MDRRARLASALRERLLESLANRISKRHVADDAFAEKREIFAALCAVEKLIDHHNVRGLVLLLQRADRADADDVADAELAHPINVGAMIQLARQDLVTAPVPRQEDDLALADAAGKKLVRRFTERRCHRHPTLPVNALH